MRKITFMLFMLLMVSITYGQSWCGNSYMTVNGTWYTGSNSYVQPSGLFQGASLGTFSGSFTLGGELQVYPAMTDPATMYYSIDDNPDFTAVSLPVNGSEGNNSKHYGETTISLSGLTAGAHTISVYFQAGTVYDSNNSANFIANFTSSSTTTDVEQNNSVHYIITSLEGNLKVTLNQLSNVELYNIGGQRIESVVCNEFTRKLNTGIYILRINGENHKVFVN